MSENWKAKAETQASKVVHSLQASGDIKSVGTFRNYKQSLTNVAQALKDANLPSLNNLTKEIAVQYLADRATEVSQKTLDLERQAMQSLLQNFNNQLAHKETLQVVKSELKQVSESRAYTQEQVRFIASKQTDRNALATEIAYSAGLRAHELLTLRQTSEQKPDARPAHEAKFSGREGASYCVTGKGGLVREIRIPDALAQRLEATRLSEPRQVTDRTVNYTQHYEIGGGKAWSSSFSHASSKHLEFSNGAHGVRHSYAQERMSELTREYTYKEALQIVSQELGHFRAEITEVYLR